MPNSGWTLVSPAVTALGHKEAEQCVFNHHFQFLVARLSHATLKGEALSCDN